jgi:hypothetical protein
VAQTAHADHAYADQQARATRQTSVFLVWDPLSPELLDQYRGGFVDISGIKISFGLERWVGVNDQFVQSLTLTIPDLTSLPLKGSAGAVSVQGPGAIEVHVNPISVNVPPITVPPITVPPITVPPSQPSPPPTGSQPVSGMESPPQVSSNPAGTSARNVPSASSPPGAVTVIQNGPGNFITSDVLRNLGPGGILVQNTLNDQVIQGLTVINAQVSGLGALIRHDVFSNLHLTLRGFGR